MYILEEYREILPYLFKQSWKPIPAGGLLSKSLNSADRAHLYFDTVKSCRTHCLILSNVSVMKII
jgi:hypothetical protein